MTNENIGRYEIQSELGRGGMATVYLAYDPNFRRKVAIKLVASNFQAEHLYRQRFEREAQLIARIEHPAIVPVYDYGEQENNLFLVMRYMPGGSLANKIKAGVLTLQDAASILSQIAPALDAVHAQGIVHRDLKPGNILFDSFGNPAISDFGIAHFTSATADLTGSAIIGTPSYMSPEQVRSDAELDGRSDIYALGVILFEMLTGHGPFQAKTPMSIALQHLTDPVPSIQLFRPDLPIEVEQILNKAMAKERESRYSTASEMALALRAVAATFQASQTPLLNPVRTTVADDAATEVDGDQSSQPDVRAPVQAEELPKLSAVKDTPPTLTDRSFQVKRTVKRPSWSLLQIVALGGVGLLLFFLCGSLGIFGTWAGLRGFFPARNPTLAATITPTIAPASTVQEPVLFSDDFSNSNSGWPTGQNAQGNYGYGPDGYHIRVSGMDQVLWAATDKVYDNSSMQVDAVPLRDGPVGYYGLLCRIQDERNFYYFVIRSDGAYTIGKYKNAEFHSFFPDGWRPSTAINRGNQSNRLRADCSANVLRLTVNNEKAAEVTDQDFASGMSGIVAAALDDQGFEVTFNNYLLTKAGQ